MHHWLRRVMRKDVGFMTRENRGPEFGSGKWAEADRNNKEDDWFHF